MVGRPAVPSVRSLPRLSSEMPPCVGSSCYLQPPVVRSIKGLASVLRLRSEAAIREHPYKRRLSLIFYVMSLMVPSCS